MTRLGLSYKAQRNAWSHVAGIVLLGWLMSQLDGIISSGILFAIGLVSLSVLFISAGFFVSRAAPTSRTQNIIFFAAALWIPYVYLIAPGLFDNPWAYLGDMSRAEAATLTMLFALIAIFTLFLFVGARCELRRRGNKSRDTQTGLRMD